MVAICPACGAEPNAAAESCPSCGAKLVVVKPPQDPLIGATIDGRFEIRGRLGQGGMGTVYRALQKTTGREIALKLMDTRYTGDTMGVRRFLREARLASSLSVPTTVSIFDFGAAADGRLFIAMELCKGRTLADVIDAEAPMSVARAARIGIQLCDGLEAAHGLGFLHRDLKPSNVIVGEKDAIKILDFGLAKSFAESESKTTGTGYVVGTPGFMAPEVLRGMDETPQSDLYAVGVILAQLVTGRDVWGTIASTELHARQARGMPAQLRVPPAIRPIVDRLLSPLAARRPASAAELRALLTPLLETSEQLAKPQAVPTRDERRTPPLPAPEPPPRTSVALPALIAAGLVVAGVAAWKHAPKPQPVTLAEPAPAPQEQPQPVAPPPPPQIVVPDIPKPVVAEATPVQVQTPPPAPQMVSIHVRTMPPGAHLRVDGVSAGKSPTTLTLPKGSEAKLDLIFETDTLHRTILADSDQDLDVYLPPPRPPEGGPRPGERPPWPPPPPR